VEDGALAPIRRRWPHSVVIRGRRPQTQMRPTPARPQRQSAAPSHPTGCPGGSPSRTSWPHDDIDAFPPFLSITHARRAQLHKNSVKWAASTPTRVTRRWPTSQPTPGTLIGRQSSGIFPLPPRHTRPAFHTRGGQQPTEGLSKRDGSMAVDRRATSGHASPIIESRHTVATHGGKEASWPRSPTSYTFQHPHHLISDHHSSHRAHIRPPPSITTRATQPNLYCLQCLACDILCIPGS